MFIDITKLNDETLNAVLTAIPKDCESLIDAVFFVAECLHKEYFIINRVIKETEKAYLIDYVYCKRKGNLVAYGNQAWFPKSQTQILSDIDGLELYGIAPYWVLNK